MSDVEIDYRRPGSRSVSPLTPSAMNAIEAREEQLEVPDADCERRRADDIAAIIPIARAVKPRTAKQLGIDIHNAGLLMRYDYGDSPSSRKYAELVDANAKVIIARDPMPSVALFDAEGVLETVHVELPGPNCLDTMSARLKLTGEERTLFRTRREDAALLLAERAEAMRAELETP